MKLGFNGDISNEEYHGDRTYVSSSSLKKMLRDPEGFYKQYVLNDPSMKLSGAALDFGTYLHTMILEPETLDDVVAVYQGKVRRGREYDKFCADNEGKIIMVKSNEEFANQLANNIRKHPAAAELFEGGQAEQTLCVELDGVKVKVRCDYLKDKQIIDLKTTGNGVSYDEMVNTCLKFDYDLSAALYCDAFTQITGEEHGFTFCFTSKQTSECAVVKASKQFLENGRKKYKTAIKQLKKARETGIYFNPKEVKEIYIPEICLFRGE
jgi:hypothetical protein